MKLYRHLRYALEYMWLEFHEVTTKTWGDSPVLRVTFEGDLRGERRVD